MENLWKSHNWRTQFFPFCKMPYIVSFIIIVFADVYSLWNFFHCILHAQEKRNQSTKGTKMKGKCIVLCFSSCFQCYRDNHFSAVLIRCVCQFYLNLLSLKYILTPCYKIWRIPLLPFMLFPNFCGFSMYLFLKFP